MTAIKLSKWTGSPIKNWRPRLEDWRRSFSLLARHPRDWGVTVLEPGSWTGNIEVKLIPLVSAASWGEQEDRWLRKLIKVLRRLYPHRGQGEKRFKGRSVREWVFYIGSAPTSLDQSSKIIEGREETLRRIEEFWEAYGIEHGFSRDSQRAFKKTLAYYGICINYVGSSRGQYEWNKMHPSFQYIKGAEPPLLTCPWCGNSNSSRIRTNEYGVHQCLVCMGEPWPL